MTHAPTPPTIPYYSLFHEQLFKIRPSPLRQFLRGILVSKPSGHSKHMIVSNQTKTISIDVDQSWFVRCPRNPTQQPLFRFGCTMGDRCKKSSTPTCTCLNGKTTPSSASHG